MENLRGKMKEEVLNTVELKIIEKFGKIIEKFEILYHDWGMDNYGYIVNDGNRNIIVTTNHGKPMETSVNYLKHKIKEYDEASEATRKAIEIFENKT